VSLAARAPRSPSASRADEKIHELDILRDLLKVLDNPSEPQQFLHNPGYMRRRVGSRLKMLPDGELPAWDELAGMNRAQIWATYGDAATEHAIESGLPSRRSTISRGTQRGRRLVELVDVVVDRLRADVENAVRRRTA
jgi:hypothetical protein